VIDKFGEEIDEVVAAADKVLEQTGEVAGMLVDASGLGAVEGQLSKLADESGLTKTVEELGLSKLLEKKGKSDGRRGSDASSDDGVAALVRLSQPRRVVTF